MRPMATATPARIHLMSSEPVFSGLSAVSMTGSSHFSSRLVPPLNGSWIAPPTMDRPARTNRGSNIVTGLS